MFRQVRSSSTNCWSCGMDCLFVRDISLAALTVTSVQGWFMVNGHYGMHIRHHLCSSAAELTYDKCIAGLRTCSCGPLLPSLHQEISNLAIRSMQRQPPATMPVRS